MMLKGYNADVIVLDVSLLTFELYEQKSLMHYLIHFLCCEPGSES